MEYYKHFLPLILLLGLSDDVTAVTLVNGTFGGSVLLNVNVPVPANSQIQWFTNGAQVAIYFPPSPPRCLSPFIGRCQLYGNGSLRIDNTSYTDEGIYNLNVLAPDASSPENTYYQLRIYATLTAPVLSSNVTSNPLISGTYMNLQCNAGNQTVTTYTFYRGQTPICPGSNANCNNSFLYFTPISGNDSGSYSCAIQNPVSTNTSNSLTLTVLVPVSNVVVTSNVSGLVWPGIDSVSLQCSALGTNVSFSWSLQGTPISGGNRFQLSGDNSTLTISPVSSSDNGSFVCTAKNVINNMTSNNVILNLASPVSAVTLTSNTSGALWAGEDSLSLNCTAQGSAITFSWSLNGNPVSLNPSYNITQSNSPPNSTLTISPISKTDTGPFTCKATNLENSLTSNALNFSINWSPDKDIQCTSETLGEIVKLGCSWSGGNPAANVTMIFNDTQTTKSEQVFTNISSSSNIHGSNLTCNGYQLGRTSSCVLIFAPPQLPNTSGSTTPTVTEGGTVNLIVNLTSGIQSRASTPSSQVLPAVFSWLRGPDNSSISNDGSKFTVISSDYASTLKIDKVSMNESGMYYCNARNFIGNTTFSFNVTVSPAPTTTPPTTKTTLSPPPPTNSSGGSGNGASTTRLNGGQIAGIVIGVVAGVAIIGIIVFFVLKKN